MATKSPIFEQQKQDDEQDRTDKPTEEDQPASARAQDHLTATGLIGGEVNGSRGILFIRHQELAGDRGPPFSDQ